MDLKNIDYIKKLSLQQKRDFITKYCMYVKMKNEVSKKNNDPSKINKTSLEIFLDSINNDYKKIFIEDFIINNPDSEWYLNNWSKNSYYKKLHFVINLFLSFVSAISK
ncbi:hypothetical protein [Mycoplasma phocoeninasale]|uniref:Uncharacterized protein n=1 Tax=Mycoplasma phocoeninasale TaxID=2726117 RepID=A0A858U3U6_9MOLU|nr:hypothetical protein [Mycoplasma phocoeninasale]MBN0970821.1 hypothetical protein [Mycoplasma phocoeninasale]QJG66681.1 hypothetical protein HGG64_03190 [Mycoplasma phocoeninasale]